MWSTTYIAEPLEEGGEVEQDDIEEGEEGEVRDKEGEGSVTLAVTSMSPGTHTDERG